MADGGVELVKERERIKARWRGEKVEKRKRERKRALVVASFVVGGENLETSQLPDLTEPYFPCAGNYERKIERARRGSHSEFTNRGNGTSTRCYVATRRHGARGAKGGECFGGCIPSWLHFIFPPLLKYILREKPARLRL